MMKLSMYNMVGIVVLLAGCGQALKVPQSEILELQDRRFAAIVDADTAALGQILADSVRYTHASGRSETKDEHVGRIGRGGIVYHRIDPVERSVLTSVSAAVVTGLVEMDITVDTLDRSLRLRFTDVYFLDVSGWRQVAWQSTHAN